MSAISAFHRRYQITYTPNSSTYPQGWTEVDNIVRQAIGINSSWYDSEIYNKLQNLKEDGDYVYREDNIKSHLNDINIDLMSGNKTFNSASSHRYGSYGSPYVGYIAEYGNHTVGSLYSKGATCRYDNLADAGYSSGWSSWFNDYLHRDGNLVYNPQTTFHLNPVYNLLNQPIAQAIATIDVVFTNPYAGYVFYYFNADEGVISAGNANHQSTGIYVACLAVYFENNKWERRIFDSIPTQFGNEGQDYWYMTCGYGAKQPPYEMSIDYYNYEHPSRLGTYYAGFKLTARLPLSNHQAGYLPPQDNFISGIFVMMTGYNVTEGESDDNNPPSVNSNPFNEPTGEESTGAGTRDNSSDIIEVGDNNTLPVKTDSPLDISGGFITAYNLTNSEMSLLGSMLWSTSVMQDIQNALYKPLENIIACYFTNAPIPNDIQVATHVKIAGYDFNENVTGNKITSNWVSVDCGNINITEYFASCLDYSPYTNVSIYLPFIGIVPLDTDYIIDSILNVRYNIDLLTGDCVAHLSNKKVSHGINYEGIISSYDGNVYASIPLTSSNTWASRNIWGMGSLIGGLLTKSPVGATMNAINTASTKPQYQKSGVLNSNTGMMGYKYPYLIIERPVDYTPTNYYKYVGLNSYVYKKLGDLKGWFKCENPILNIKSDNYEPPAPLESEVEEIKSLLSKLTPEDERFGSNNSDKDVWRLG